VQDFREELRHTHHTEARRAAKEKLAANEREGRELEKKLKRTSQVPSQASLRNLLLVARRPQPIRRLCSQAMEETTSFNCIDLFSGIGGMSLGFSGLARDVRCSFKPRLMADIDPEAREVAQRNLPSVPFLVADIHHLSAGQIRRHAALSTDDTVHVLLGGPPCQGFSYLGKRALEDERNALVLDYLRMVKELKPLVAVMENVPLLMSAHNGAFIQEICEGLSLLGYSSAADVLTASDYGVPQLRKRAIVIGYRRDLGLALEFPARTHERVTAAALTNANGRVLFEKDRLPYVSVEDAIGDLPPLKAGQGEEVSFYTSEPRTSYQHWAREGSLAIFNHRSRAHKEKYLDKISIIKEGAVTQTCLTISDSLISISVRHMRDLAEMGLLRL
jgi:DNA (cytosine-5)-methyltransferase 1